MGSYVDIAGKLPAKVRHWYVCGSDRGMVVAAVHELREHARRSTSRVEYVDGAKTTSGELQALLRGAGMVSGEEPPLVVLENAQEHDLSWLMRGQSRDFPSSLLAIGDEERPSGTDARYTYFVKRQAGRMVLCRPTTAPRLVNWVQRRLLCAKDTAMTLVTASGGDTLWLAHEVQKLQATGAGETLHPAHIPHVTSPTAVADFVEHMLLGNKRAAVQSIPTTAAAPTVLRRLEDVVLKGALVYEAQKNVGWSARQMLSRTGLSQTELAMLRPHVNTFGRPATERRLRALARVSSRAIRGDRRAWQSLVALW